MKKDIKIIRGIYFKYEIFQELVKASEELKMSRSQIVNQAVKKYLDSLKMSKIHELKEELKND